MNKRFRNLNLDKYLMIKLGNENLFLLKIAFMMILKHILHL